MSMTSTLLLRPDLSSKIHPKQPKQEQKQEKEQEQEQEKDFTFLGIDHSDRFPDSLLLLVFNKIGDVKALGQCCVVSRRFHCLYSLWTKISDGADRRIQAPGWRSLHGAGFAPTDLAAQAGPSDIVAQDRSRSSSKEALRFDFEMINKQIGLIFIWFRIK